MTATYPRCLPFSRQWSDGLSCGCIRSSAVPVTRCVSEGLRLSMSNESLAPSRTPGCSRLMSNIPWSSPSLTRRVTEAGTANGRMHPFPARPCDAQDVPSPVAHVAPRLRFLQPDTVRPLGNSRSRSSLRRNASRGATSPTRSISRHRRPEAASDATNMFTALAEGSRRGAEFAEARPPSASANPAPLRDTFHLAVEAPWGTPADISVAHPTKPPICPVHCTRPWAMFTSANLHATSLPHFGDE